MKNYFYIYWKLIISNLVNLKIKKLLQHANISSVNVLQHVYWTKKDLSCHVMRYFFKGLKEKKKFIIEIILILQLNVRKQYTYFFLTLLFVTVEDFYVRILYSDSHTQKKKSGTYSFPISTSFFICITHKYVMMWLLVELQNKI